MVSLAPSDLYVKGSRHSLVHCEVLYMIYRCDGRQIDMSTDRQVAGRVGGS